MQRVGSLTVVPQLLHGLGIDPNKVAMSSGIDLTILRNPENFIPFMLMGRLMKACSRTTGCEHFGLLVGKTGSLATLGILGRLMQNAHTVGQAIRDLLEHQHCDVRGALPYLVVSEGTANFGHAVYQSGIEGSTQIYDDAITQLFNFIVELSGIRPLEISFPHMQPADVVTYERYFQVKLRFDEDEAKVVFPTELLDLPVRGANPALRLILESAIVARRLTTRPCLRDQVLRHLRIPVNSRISGLDDTAKRMLMQPRTLNRRLREKGTSFRQLRNECRLEVARQLLQNTELSITHIGMILDYADPAVFSHALRRLSGSSPSVLRAILQQ